MSSLKNLNARLQYRGGNAENRMIQDKLTGLRRSLLYSYQAETITLNDGRKFRCLINPNKETTDYDNKIISIPYEDICLNKPHFGEKTSEGMEYVGLKPGDVFYWDNTDSYWLVYLEYLEENAYFRAQIRKCEVQVDVNGEKYWAYIRGPVETSVTWNQKRGVEWNDLNYSLIMYITRDENTLDYFHRFSKLKVPEPLTGKLKTWQVVGTNPYSGDGIIELALDEYFENEFQDKLNEELSEKPVVVGKEPQIVGPTHVTSKSFVKYDIKNCTDGIWYVSYNGVESEMTDKEQLSLDIWMKSGEFTVIYKKDGETVSELQVTVVPI